MQISATPSGFSADTEILTRRGWLAFSALGPGVQVATLSPVGQFEWQRPATLSRHTLNGDLAEFSNKAVSILVAPDHPLLVRAAYTSRNQWHMRTARYFLTHSAAKYEIPLISSWSGIAPRADFTLPGQPSTGPHPAKDRAAEWLINFLCKPWTPSAGVTAEALAAGITRGALSAAREALGIPKRRIGGWKQKSHWELGLPTKVNVPTTGPSKPLRGFCMPTESFCRFLGLYLAEGWVRNDRNGVVIISQSPGSRHLPEIQDILESTGLNWNWSPHNRRFSANHKVLAAWLQENCGCGSRNKRIPAAFKELPPGYLNLVLRGMMIGDGSWTPASMRRYYSTSKHLAEDVQEILQKLGRDSRIGSRDRPQANHHRLYTVFERLSDTHLLPKAARREYRGYVYSASIQNSVVYVRRNGNPAWVPADHS